MALFQLQEKQLSYQMLERVLPNDTLFIHGNLGSNRWWQPTFDLLSDRNVSGQVGRAVRAEWLGCGKSSAPQDQEDLNMFSLAKDYIALAKGLGLTQVNLVGHSTGGLIALCALLLEPSLFNKVILLDSVSAEGVQFGPEMYEAFTKMSTDKSFCDMIMASTIHKCDVTDPLVQELFNDAFGVNKMIWHGVANSLKSINILPDLKRIEHPVLVMHGEFDTLLPITGSKQIANHLPNGQFFEIKGHGHCTNVEDPIKFVELLSAFLSMPTERVAPLTI